MNFSCPPHRTWLPVLLPLTSLMPAAFDHASQATCMHREELESQESKELETVWVLVDWNGNCVDWKFRWWSDTGTVDMSIRHTRNTVTNSLSNRTLAASTGNIDSANTTVSTQLNSVYLPLHTTSNTICPHLTPLSHCRLWAQTSLSVCSWCCGNKNDHSAGTKPGHIFSDFICCI